MAVREATKKMSKEEVKVDMTPMIDVTFLLLIFFMCTLNFQAQEGNLIAYLPKDLGSMSKMTKQDPVEPINVKLVGTKKTGTVIWLGSERYTGKDKFKKLYNKIVAIAKSTGGGPVLIDPEIETPFKDVIQTLNVCRKINKEIEQKAYRVPNGKILEIRFSAKAIADSKDKK